MHEIIGLRQSAYSNEVTDKLLELKRLMNKGNYATQQFWQDIPTKPEVCYLLRSFSEQTSALFREACSKWPNNSRIAEEYSAFLIDCCTDFSQGVKQKHISNLIEHGKNFIVGYSFRSLIAAYPEYIKKGYVDMEGVISKERNSESEGQGTRTKTAKADPQFEALLAKMAHQVLTRGVHIRESYMDFDRHNSGNVTQSQFFRTMPLRDMSAAEMQLLVIGIRARRRSNEGKCKTTDRSQLTTSAKRTATRNEFAAHDVIASTKMARESTNTMKMPIALARQLTGS